MTSRKIEVVSLGLMAGGSYGAGGNPSEVYEFWTLKYEGDTSAFPARGNVFRSKADAEEAARRAREYAREEDFDRLNS